MEKIKDKKYQKNIKKIEKNSYESGQKILSIADLKGKRVHFAGIGGISMSALAQILERFGCYVQGSDLADNDEVKKLKKRNILVFDCHKSKNLYGIDVFVYSSAIHEDNDELKFAQTHRLVILKRAELLGIVASSYKTVISVAGSHGKTTATAMISEIFMRANLKPTLHIGGPLNSIHSNYKIGNKKFFITESCEYMDNFMFVKPDIAVVLNVDSDHLDYFKDLNGVKKSFLKFSQNLRQGGICFACTDDKNSEEICCGENVATFGFGSIAKNKESKGAENLRVNGNIKEKSVDLLAKNIKEYQPCKFSFDAYFCGCLLGNIRLNILGKHNIYNALASLLVSLACGIDFEISKEAIENFSGVERRCQIIGEKDDVLFIHDYAHHPVQIEKMIKVGRELAEKRGGKLVVVFEPHTFSRTKFLLEDFARSFVGSDHLIFAPVYSAREDESEGKNSLDLAVESERFNQSVEYFESYEEIKTRIEALASSHDVVMILGAGTIENLARMFA